MGRREEGEALAKDVGIGEPGRVGQGRSGQEWPNSYRRSRLANPATFKVQLDHRAASGPEL